MENKIKKLGTISVVVGVVAGLWVWWVMFVTYMSATGTVQTVDLVVGLSPSALAILLTIYTYKKALRAAVFKKRLVFTFFWCAIPSLLLLLEAVSH